MVVLLRIRYLFIYLLSFHEKHYVFFILHAISIHKLSWKNSFSPNLLSMAMRKKGNFYLIGRITS